MTVKSQSVAGHFSVGDNVFEPVTPMGSEAGRKGQRRGRRVCNLSERPCKRSIMRREPRPSSSIFGFCCWRIEICDRSTWSMRWPTSSGRSPIIQSRWQH